VQTIKNNGGCHGHTAVVAVALVKLVGWLTFRDQACWTTLAEVERAGFE
jgi:hypothetical protein